MKAVSSFCGPFIAAFAAGALGNWQYLFPIYAVVTLLSGLWLLLTPIKEEAPQTKASTFSEVFGILKDKTILLLFLGIFFIVGVDVGVNTVSPKLLIERCGWAVEKAGLGASVYFVCRTVGALLGSVILAKMSDVKYFRWNMIAAAAALAALFFVKGTIGILVLIGMVGFFCSSIFSVIYSQAMQARSSLSESALPTWYGVHSGLESQLRNKRLFSGSFPRNGIFHRGVVQDQDPVKCLSDIWRREFSHVAFVF